jgi:pilus assembly protein TadC
MKIDFERLVSRNVANALSRELRLSGVRMPVGRFIEIAILGGFAIFIFVPFFLYLVENQSTGVATIAAFASAAGYEAVIYMLLEFRIDQRKSFVEGILPDYLQLTAANVRSGIALDKSMILAARPEFKFFSSDVKELTKELYAGVSFRQALLDLSNSYRSLQVQHTIRMILESVQYGGGMTDLLNQIAKDMRNQSIVQKEVSGQLFMYTIFIAFATVIGAPVLFALTSEMITVTDTIWVGISAQNPTGLQASGVSFLKLSAPQVSSAAYYNFSIIAVLLMTGFGAFIVSTISTGSVFKGMKYLPLFLAMGIAVFYITSIAMSGVFSTISGI